MTAELHQAPVWKTTRFEIDLGQPQVMGIVNVTPDSFSDGGHHDTVQAAIAHGLRLAEQAAKQAQTHTRYLEALLEAEVEERERNAIARRIQEARFQKVKTLEDFDFS